MKRGTRSVVNTDRLVGRFSELNKSAKSIMITTLNCGFFLGHLQKIGHC